MTVLPVPPFGENTVMIRPWRACAALGRQAAAGVGRLAEREDDVLGQLRQQEDVGDAFGVERLVEQRGRLARGEDHDRRARVLADRGHLVRREATSSGWRARRTWRCPPARAAVASATFSLQPTKSSSGWVGETLAQAVEPVAGAGHVDAGAARCSLVRLLPAPRSASTPASCELLRTSRPRAALSTRSRRSPGCRPPRWRGAARDATSPRP